jgi:chemotaxis family two-component system sensor kinase Cph1
VVTSGPLPSVRIHEPHLEQLFQNLIGNAIKYRTDGDPRIEIAAERVADEWIFSIRDNGIGIDPQYKEYIFGIFKRLHSASEYSGTGIGLAICQRIIERAGGRIWVESQLGQGSTFFFSIPAADKRG